jgi:hypothetical protein
MGKKIKHHGMASLIFYFGFATCFATWITRALGTEIVATGATEPVSVLLNPIIQYGFAGFCGVLLGMEVWHVKTLIRVISEHNQLVLSSNMVITKNTETIAEVLKSVADMALEARRVFEAMLSRPCLLDPKVLKLLNVSSCINPLEHEGTGQ